MNTLGKVLFLIVIGFLLQVVVVFIALQIEGDISGAGKGTYAIPYIMCYVFAWIIVFKKNFPKFLFDDKSENPKKEIITDKKPEIKEMQKKEVLKQPLKKENIYSDSLEKSNFNPFPILGIIVFVLVIIIMHESGKEIKTDRLGKEDNIFKVENIFKHIPSGYFDNPYEMGYYLIETPDDPIFSGMEPSGQRLYLSNEKLMEGFSQFYKLSNFDDEWDKIFKTPLNNYSKNRFRLINLISQYPDKNILYANLSVLESAHKKGSKRNAVVLISKAIDVNSLDIVLSQLYYWRGLSKESLGDKLGSEIDYKKSVEYGEKLLNIEPKNPFYLFVVGRSLSELDVRYSTKAYDTSIIYFKKALENYNQSSFEEETLIPSPMYEYFDDYKSVIYQNIVNSYQENVIEGNSTNRQIGNIIYKRRTEFCLILSKAGELGYSDAYKAIEKYCPN